MNTTAIKKLQKQLEVLQSAAGEDTSIGQALVLLEVALNPGALITQLADVVHGDHSHTMISRAVDILGSHQGRNTRREPADLLERRDVPGDRRAREIHLTPKGKRLMDELTRIQ